MVKYILALLLSFYISSTCGQSQVISAYKDSLENRVKESKKARILLRISEAYRTVQLDSMYAYANKALLVAESQGNSRDISRARLDIGISLWRRGDLENGSLEIQKALIIAREFNDTTLEVRSLRNIGMIANYKGNYSIALSQYQSAMKLAQEAKDSSNISLLLKNIGGVHFNIDDFDLALEYWLHSLDLWMILGDSSETASVLNNIGSVHSGQGNIKKALEYFKKSINYYENEDCGSIYSLANIADTYEGIGKSDSASFYYQQAIHVSEKCNGFVGSIAIFIAMASVENDNGNPFGALNILKQAEERAVKSEYLRELGIIYSSISQLYEEMENYNEALNYFQKFYLIQDSISNSESSKQIAQLEAQYKYEQLEKERIIEGLENDRRAVRQNWISGTLIMGFSGLSVFAWFTYSNLKKKKQLNTILKNLNNEVLKQKEELHNRAVELKRINDQLNTVNESLELRISHRTSELKTKNEELNDKNKKLAEYAFMNAHKLRVPVANLLGLVELFEEEDPKMEFNETVIRNIRTSAQQLDAVVNEIQNSLAEKNH